MTDRKTPTVRASAGWAVTDICVVSIHLRDQADDYVDEPKWPATYAVVEAGAYGSVKQVVRGVGESGGYLWLKANAQARMSRTRGLADT